MEFPRLFEPGRIGKLELKNRIIFPPMVTHFATEERMVSDVQLDYYAERARGGAGTIVVEACNPIHGNYMALLRIDDDRYIPRLADLAKAIEAAGARAFVQLLVPSEAPGQTPDSFSGREMAPLSKADLKAIIAKYSQGVRRAREAGFSGIMIHGAASYLVANVLSPLSNKRTDEYGGSLGNRARLAVELLDATRRVVGPGYPIVFRLMCNERVPGGITTQDAIVACKMLQDAGADAIDVTAGKGAGHEYYTPPMYLPQACNIDVSAEIRKALMIPVSVVGKINDPVVAEKALTEVATDFVDMGRALMADPHLPLKALEGRMDDIRPCIACLRCHEAVLLKHGPIECAVNPELAREREFQSQLAPAARPKKVLVIGGGPAGIQAALAARKRGHAVTLWESGAEVGGQLLLARLPSGKGDIGRLLDYLKVQLGKSGAAVEMKKKATARNVLESGTDAVIVAAGSVPAVPDIPGIEGENVIDCRQVLSGKKKTGQKVVVMGGGLVGCETACFLAERGKQVTLVFRSSAPASDVLHPDNKKLLLQKLQAAGVAIRPGVKEYKEITPAGIRLVESSGKKVLLKADTIVLAAGAAPDKKLANALKGKVAVLYEAGDCVEPAKILEAVHSGAEAGLKV